MSIAPLFVKCRTKAGNYYVYDPCTNEILRIGESIYTILDDYHILDTDEMIEKHHAIAETTVREALSQLDGIQARSILRDHPPQLSNQTEEIYCEGKRESLRAFLRYRRRLLTLELTQQCNLACEYCCYGKYYPQTRKPSTAPMPLEVAKKAVEDFMGHRPKRGSIGFYGGEPLLQFELLKQIVLFAEELADRYGTNVKFSMTTNGTLLTDETIHFLVRHRVRVMISLDGDKETHDRYRVFRSEKCPEQRTGSFDVIVGNMERFVQLYPNYMDRGIMVTFTATSDFDEVQRFLSRWQPSFPTVNPSFVLPVSGSRGEASDCPIELGLKQANSSRPTG
jgi:uncharacterized protein